eukprot:822747-Prymnesium_polylepis.1
MMRDLGGANIHHPYTAHIHAFCARKSRYSSSHSLAWCLGGTTAAVRGGVRHASRSGFSSVRRRLRLFLGRTVRSER